MKEYLHIWWVEFAFLFFAALILNFLLKKTLLYLKRFFQRDGHSWKESAAEALIAPLTSVIWLLFAFYTANILWNQFSDEPLISTKKAIISITLIVSASWFLMRWKKMLVSRMLRQSMLGPNPQDYTKIDLINKLATVAIFVLASLLILEQAGGSINSLIAIGGIGGLALAFASQQIISNFFGGMMIYFTQPFSIGETIQLPEKQLEGVVEEIGWYTTQIRTSDKRPLYIPNSFLANALLINPSRMTHRQFKAVLSLRYQDIASLQQVIAEIEQLLLKEQRIDQSIAPQVHFTAFGQSGLDVLVTAFTTGMNKLSFSELNQELLFNIAAIFKKHGVEFASPIAK